RAGLPAEEFPKESVAVSPPPGSTVRGTVGPSERPPGMATGDTNPLLRYLRRFAATTKAQDASDGELMESFVSDRDNDAFAALFRRHGPMVLGLCRRVLGNAADADDAFQA